MHELICTPLALQVTKVPAAPVVSAVAAHVAIFPLFAYDSYLVM
jgi:hypothetical protein